MIQPASTPAQEPGAAANHDFAHDSERHFAELLDFYGVRWDYEPVEFVLEWHEDGTPKAAFRPDFYMPDFHCFIELTTLNQKLVTRKNAKLRRLRALYPEVDVKLMYQRDYLALLAKYGFRRPSSPAA